MVATIRTIRFTDTEELYLLKLLSYYYGISYTQVYEMRWTIDDINKAQKYIQENHIDVEEQA